VSSDVWVTNYVFTSVVILRCAEHCRGRKVLENRNVNDEERIVQLEKELEETIMLGEESDRKFEEVTLAPTCCDT